MHVYGNPAETGLVGDGSGQFLPDPPHSVGRDAIVAEYVKAVKRSV